MSDVTKIKNSVCPRIVYDRTKIHMPFGIFTDMPISDIPTWYLDKSVDWIKNKNLLFAIIEELQARQDYHEMDYDIDDVVF